MDENDNDEDARLVPLGSSPPMLTQDSHQMQSNVIMLSTCRSSPQSALKTILA